MVQNSRKADEESDLDLRLKLLTSLPSPSENEKRGEETVSSPVTPQEGERCRCKFSFQGL